MKNDETVFRKELQDLQEGLCYWQQWRISTTQHTSISYPITVESGWGEELFAAVVQTKFDLGKTELVQMKMVPWSTIGFGYAGRNI